MSRQGSAFQTNNAPDDAIRCILFGSGIVNSLLYEKSSPLHNGVAVGGRLRHFGTSGQRFPQQGAAETTTFAVNEANIAAETEALAAARQLLATGRSTLRSRIPGLRVVDNPFGTAPQIVDLAGSTAALTEPSDEAHETLFRRFIVENAALYGLTAAQARQLHTVADYTNPAGNLSWVQDEQRINGLQVFQGYLRADLTGDGRIWRPTGDLAAGLDYTHPPIMAQMTAPAAAIAAARSRVGHRGYSGAVGLHRDCYG